MEIETDEPISTHPVEEHYYGDIVRKIFVFCGVLMLLEYAFFSSLIAFPGALSIAAVITLIVLAGLQSPEQHVLSYINTAVSIAACFVFAYTGFNHFLRAEIFNPWFFWSNQVLAISFLVTTYFCCKTLRAMRNEAKLAKEAARTARQNKLE